jgi:DNA-binding GntR family transcriptional regulator
MSRPARTSLKRPADTAGHVFERLVEAILNGEFMGGQPLREAALARAWQVSRTPLREAVRRAAEHGLLILRPNQPPLVRPMSPEDVRSLYELREVLEIHALRCAWPRLVRGREEEMLAQAREVAPRRPKWEERCLRLDRDLHQWWTDLCGNPWLRADLGRHLQFLRIFQLWIGRDPAALIQGYHEHLAILEAIQNKDLKGACRALSEHIRSSGRLVEQAIRSDPTGGKGAGR